MARMHPDVACVESESRAEQKLYRLLKKNLPDDFVVFHSVAYWLSDGRAPRPKRGEADFVIVHRELGLLVIEVKGGRIRFDAKRERWTSNRNKIKNPFEQAKRCAGHIQQAIDRSGILRNGRSFRCQHAVAFPDCVVDGTPLASWVSRSLLIDASDAGRIRERIVDIMRDARAPGQRPLTRQQERRLCQEVLVRHFDLGLKLNGAIAWEKQALAMLTEDQSICLDFLALNKRCEVRGPAGTGKTVTAVEWARRQAQNGDSVLMVCFNRPLAHHLRAALHSCETARPSCWAGAYHQLCEEWAHEAGLDFRVPDEASAAARFWDEGSTQLLMRAAERLERRFDALIVDEAQDMHADWWPAMLRLLRDPATCGITLLCDPHQNIYGRQERYPVTSPVFPLRTNCRNTRPISEFFMSLIDDSERYSVLSGGGTEPLRRSYSSPKQQVTQMNKDLTWLIERQRIQPEQIVILGTHRLENSSLANVVELAGHPIAAIDDSREVPQHSLRYSTLHRYKGLEADVVLFCDIDGNERSCTSNHLYVGSSRAKHRLYLYVAENVSLPA